MSYDAIIVGAGHNGLVTGIYLARAGWKVLILERNAKPGGAVQTAEVTLPGFRHDLFATNLNLFAGSPFFQEFKTALETHGLAFAPVEHPFCSAFPDGSYVGVSAALDTTLASIRAIAPADADAWQRLVTDFPATAAHLLPLLGERMPSWSLVRALYRGYRTQGVSWLLETGRLLVSSTREFAEQHFTDARLHSMVSAWGMHLGFTPDMAGGALFGYLEPMANQAFGMVLGKGGADNLVNALVGVYKSLGGELRLDAEVTEIEVEHGKASGVRLADERLTARKAVIANLAPRVLYGALVTPEKLPAAFLRKVQRYRHGAGAMMIHLALDGPLDWTASDELSKFAYVHIGPYLADMTRTYMEVNDGLLPSTPTLVVGQPTAADPSRAPVGKHILWVQVRSVPGVIGGDALNEINATDWDTAKLAFADRVIAKIAEYAPGIDGAILGRAVLSPADLEQHNPNLIGGDSLGGEHTLRQNFLFRPFPGWSRYSTPIRSLYMVGASTWPGAGVGAGSGRLLGKMLT